jgi:hypothetical protein
MWKPANRLNFRNQRTIERKTTFSHSKLEKCEVFLLKIEQDSKWLIEKNIV